MIILLLISYGIILFLLITILTIIVFLILNSIYELPYVGAKRQQIELMLKLANIQKGEIVVDLGSGDGRLLIAAAKRGAKTIGYEINPIIYLISRIKVKLSGFSHQITIKKESLWKADLSAADVVFVYALRKSMPKFEQFIFNNAKRETRVLANTNPFPNKKALQSTNPIFLYRS